MTATRRRDLSGVWIALAFLAVASAGASVVATASADGGKRYATAKCRFARERPRHIIIACGDGGYQLRKLSWDDWGGSTSHGHGIFMRNDCDPYCAAGTFHYYDVRVRLSRVRHCHGYGDKRFYTRARLRGEWHGVYEVSCPL